MSKLRRGRVTGPLARYEAGFANALAVEGYAPGSIGNQQLRMAQLSRWLETEGLDTGALSAEVVERFLASRRAAGCSYYVTLRGFSPLLDSLRGLGAAPSGPAPAMDTPLEILMQRYAAYLLRERGLRPESAVDYVRAAKAFLAYRSGEGEPDADGLSAGEVIGYVRCECAGDTVAHARRTTSRLRALLRFLFVDGVTDTPLADLVPSVANRRDDFVPTATSPGDVARLLSSCDRRTTVGRRDFAILTVLSRLGLRAGEVARLRLRDLDWRAGQVVIRGKGDRVEPLPLPVDVGETLVGWLHRGRPRGECRYVFTRLRAPLGGLSNAGISMVVARACERACLPKMHAHRLRHSAATEMLHAGASLAEVGSVLRHSRLATTSIYATVDQRGLSAVIRPWPVGA
jgi:integrase/recombinase XerD